MDGETNTTQDDIVTTTALREEITTQLVRLKVIISTSKPPEVQELVLAQRHLEDARMRLGVAVLCQGHSWVNKVEKKAK